MGTKNLSQEDYVSLAGPPSIYNPEPEQLNIPHVTVDPTIVSTQLESEKYIQKMKRVRDKAEKAVAEVEKVKSQLDKECSHLSVSSGEEKGSRLYQAMFRVFGKRTTDISYQDYSSALDIRDKLADVAAERMKSK